MTVNYKEAEQIIDVNQENKITLNEDILRSILLKDDIKDKQVCVVSITGEFRQGKSFLLNFFIKYLRIKKRLEINDDWLTLSEGPVTGFPWKGGRNRLTTGILIWPEIFLSELPSGEEIAIILLDTQGSFDNRSTTTQCAAIFALSTLISSVQIYNLKEDIKQNDLSHLACFSNYGQIVAKSKKSPFQKLVFLIRDWRWKQERVYGAEGGQQRLDEILNNTENSSEELTSHLQKINTLYEDKSCCLLPHPGQKVASELDFQGNIKDIDSEFKKYVQEFTSTILAPNNLVPKTNLNGNKIKVGDLFTYIREYCMHFQDCNVPSPQSMYMATCEAHYYSVINESEAVYDDLMKCINDEDSKALRSQLFAEKHYDSKAKAMKFFQEKEVMGDDNMKKKYAKQLESKLDAKCLTYKNIDKNKYKKEQYEKALGNTNSFFKFIRKPWEVIKNIGIARSYDKKYNTKRNTMEALSNCAGCIGGGVTAGAGGVAATTAVMLAIASGPLTVVCSAVIVGVSVFYIGSHGGSKIASGITETILDNLKCDITRKHCVNCKESLEMRNYKGQFRVCPACAQELYNRKLVDSKKVV